jgi:hypothetical protein
VIFTRLPEGYRQASLDTVFAADARARLAEAARVLGSRGAAETAARHAGRYELDEACLRTLGLAGIELGENGELPALSPERWAELPEPAPQSGELIGLLLTAPQREAFSRFLARNHVSNPSAERLVAIARHYFTDSLNVVIR